MVVRITTLYATTLCLVWIDLISCALVTGGIRPKYRNLDPASKYSHCASVDNQLNSEGLSSETFPVEITELLSPEMFSQPDPLTYFLEKTIYLPLKKSFVIAHKLENLLFFGSFPSRYIPYAELLKNLMKCLLNLYDVRIALKKMRFSNADDPPLPAGILSPMLAELFSFDVLLDDKCLILSLAKFPKDEIRDLWYELKTASLKHKFPEFYRKYCAELLNFGAHDYYLPKLVESISKMRNITSGKSSATQTNGESDFKRP